MAKAAVALLAIMAFAAVASAQDIKLVGGKDGKEPKKVIVKPDYTAWTEQPHGKPQPLQKPTFVKNNTIVKQQKPVQPPKVKEAPVKDNTQPFKNNEKVPRPQFVLNNTIIKNHTQKQIKQHFKEAPIKDNTQPFKNNEKIPRPQFIFNNTHLPKPQIVKEPKWKEEPIKDITNDYSHLYKGEKKLEGPSKQEKQQEQHDFNKANFGPSKNLP